MKRNRGISKKTFNALQSKIIKHLKEYVEIFLENLGTNQNQIGIWTNDEISLKNAMKETSNELIAVKLKQETIERTK